MTNPALVAYARGAYKSYVKTRFTAGDDSRFSGALEFHRATLTTALIEIERRHLIVESLPKLGDIEND